MFQSSNSSILTIYSLETVYSFSDHGSTTSSDEADTCAHVPLPKSTVRVTQQCDAHWLEQQRENRERVALLVSILKATLVLSSGDLLRDLFLSESHLQTFANADEACWQACTEEIKEFEENINSFYCNRKEKYHAIDLASILKETRTEKKIIQRHLNNAHAATWKILCNTLKLNNKLVIKHLEKEKAAQELQQWCKHPGVIRRDVIGIECGLYFWEKFIQRYNAIYQRERSACGGIFRKREILNSADFRHLYDKTRPNGGTDMTVDELGCALIDLHQHITAKPKSRSAAILRKNPDLNWALEETLIAYGAFYRRNPTIDDSKYQAKLAAACKSDRNGRESSSNRLML